MLTDMGVRCDFMQMLLKWSEMHIKNARHHYDDPLHALSAICELRRIMVGLSSVGFELEGQIEAIDRDMDRFLVAGRPHLIRMLRQEQDAEVAADLHNTIARIDERCGPPPSMAS
jgi:hypothetical protein